MSLWGSPGVHLPFRDLPFELSWFSAFSVDPVFLDSALKPDGSNFGGFVLLDLTKGRDAATVSRRKRAQIGADVGCR